MFVLLLTECFIVIAGCSCRTDEHRSSRTWQTGPLASTPTLSTRVKRPTRLLPPTGHPHLQARLLDRTLQQVPPQAQLQAASLVLPVLPVLQVPSAATRRAVPPMAPPAVVTSDPETDRFQQDTFGSRHRTISLTTEQTLPICLITGCPTHSPTGGFSA